MPEWNASRREFLRAAAGAAATTALPGCLAGLPPDGDLVAATAILKAAVYDDAVLAAAVEQGMQLVPPPDVRGKRVVLKPNLVDLPRDGRPAVTHPAVVVAVADAFRRRGAGEIIVADGPALQRDAVEIADASGLTPRLCEHRLPFVDLNLDDPVRTPNAGSALGIPDLFLAATAARADVLVSIPKMKTHHWAGASLSMKNGFGLLPAAVYGWPRSRFHRVSPHNAVVDFNRTRPFDYCVVDAVVAMQGDGPIRGEAIDVGAIIVGDNAAAVDATAARLMRLHPERIPYLQMAAGRIGPIGEDHIEQRGETIAALARPFAIVPHLDMLQA